MEIHRYLKEVEIELDRALDGKGYRKQELVDYLPQNKQLMSALVDLATEMLFQEDKVLAVPNDGDHFYFMRSRNSIPKTANIITKGGPTIKND